MSEATERTGGSRSRGRSLAAALRLVWGASPALAVALAVAVLVTGLLPVGFTIVIGVVIDAVPPAVAQGLDSAAGGHLWSMLGVLLAIYLAQVAFGNVQGVLAGSLGSRFTLAFRGSLMDETLGPRGIAHLEDPAIADELGFIQSDEQRFFVGSLVQQATVVTSKKIEGLGSAVVLFAFAWWAPPVIFIGSLFAYRWVNREMETLMSSWHAVTPGLRRATYLRSLSVEPSAAKELRVFGLGGWLVDRFSTQWTSAMQEVWAERKGHAGPLIHVAAAEFVGSALVYAMIAQAAVTGRIGVGAIAIFARAVHGMWSLGPMGQADINVRRGLEIVGRVNQLRDRIREPHAVVRGTHEDVPDGDIAFDGVSFTYPGTTQPVLDGLTLDIPRGRSIAIVGLNGAGKTTLIKLLARLYDPDSGRITVGGRDVAEFDPDAWRRRMGVIFQDFVRFELSARANVGFGGLPRMGDDPALVRAATKAGALDIIDGLTDGWDTALSRGYEKGAELSGGQWQRIALARALMSLETGADILVLDEPTANLDVRAEADLFDRFLDITSGATTVLISHRFSTVRRADRIAVVDAGRVVECGTHAELVSAAGTYARLFRLQAERFMAGDDG